MTSYLTDVKAVIPYLYQTHHLIGYDMEDKDIQCVVADIYK